MESAIQQLSALVQQQQQQIAALQQQHQQPGIVQPKTSEAAKPSRFLGDAEDVSSAADWLFQLEAYFEACGTPEDRRLKLLPTYIASHALRWWRGIPEAHRPQIWAGFKTALNEQYTPAMVIMDAREKLAHIKQHRSAREYTNRFRELLLQLPDVSPAEALDRFKRGLKPNVRMMVELASPQTWTEAATKAESVDTIQFLGRTSFGQRSGPSYQRRDSTITPATRSTDGPTPINVGAVAAGGDTAKERRKQQDARLGHCFYCHKPGHVARLCPAKPKDIAAQSSNRAERSGNWRSQ